MERDPNTMLENIARYSSSKDRGVTIIDENGNIEDTSSPFEIEINPGTQGPPKHSDYEIAPLQEHDFEKDAELHRRWQEQQGIPYAPSRVDPLKKPKTHYWN